MDPHILEADFSDPLHCAGLVEVLDSYASDPVGGGERLSPEVQRNLIPELRKIPTVLALLAFHEGRAVGAAVCFFGFSTFQARPLLNVHDLAVVPEYRGQGIGHALLKAVEARASEYGCCKLTLEVQEGNRSARQLYEKFGFGEFIVGNSAATRFLAKPI